MWTNVLTMFVKFIDFNKERDEEKVSFFSIVFDFQSKDHTINERRFFFVKTVFLGNFTSLDD